MLLGDRILGGTDRAGRSIGAAGRYLRTARPLAGLLWRVGPALFLTSCGLALLGGLVPAANVVVVSELLQTIVDGGRSAGRHAAAVGPRFVLLIGLLAVLGLLAQITERLGQTVTRLLGIRISNRVQLLIADKAAAVDLESFEDRTFQNKMRTVADEAPYLPHQVVVQLLGTIATLTTLASLGGIIIGWHLWALVLLALAAVPSLWLSARFGSVRVTVTAGRAEAARNKQYLYTALVSEPAAKEIRLFGLRGLLLSRLSGLVAMMYRQDRSLALRELGWSLPAGLVLAAAQVALIAFAAIEALHGSISVGRFNAYLLAIVQLSALLPVLAYSAGSLHQNNLFAARLFDFLATEPMVEAPRDPLAGEMTAGGPRIIFDHVSFTYPGTDREILHDVSFHVHAGEVMAFVGSNGSGKSTIVKLLAGLYEPTAGSVKLNGIDIRRLDRAALRSNLSIIFQDFVVYHFSARENIGLGQLRYLDDQERITAAARRSGLDRVIARLPDGFDTVLGRMWDKGHELSGGQRQLVALARALLRQAPVLILDEPSSALDVRTEMEFFHRLLEGVARHPAHCTIFISHRPSTVRRADRILVLHDGRIAEQGSHESLMERSGAYAEIFRLQAAAYGPERHQRTREAAVPGESR